MRQFATPRTKTTIRLKAFAVATTAAGMLAASGIGAASANAESWTTASTPSASELRVVTGPKEIQAEFRNCRNKWQNHVSWSAHRNGAVTYLPGRLCLKSGDRHLVFQRDGNFVLHRGQLPVWASGTHNQGASKIVFQRDGNVVIYRAHSGGQTPIWASQTNGSRSNSSYFKLFPLQTGYKLSAVRIVLNPNSSTPVRLKQFVGRG